MFLKQIKPSLPNTEHGVVGSWGMKMKNRGIVLTDLYIEFLFSCVSMFNVLKVCFLLVFGEHYVIFRCRVNI